MEEVDYLVCNNCETPCYVFELNAEGKVATAFCQVCGNDDEATFTIPDIDEIEPEE